MIEVIIPYKQLINQLKLVVVSYMFEICGAWAVMTSGFLGAETLGFLNELQTWGGTQNGHVMGTDP